MKWLDYIYYRVTKAYMKWDGETGITGIMVVAMIVSLTIIDIWGFIHVFFFFDTYGNQYKEEAKLIGLIFMFFILVFFFIRYRKRYPRLKKRWQHETKIQHNIRGIGVILAIALPIAIPVLYFTFFC